MSLIQRMFRTALPQHSADALEAESRRWKIRCCTCGAERSVWEAGGIRWGAASAGKRTLVWCSHCRWFRPAAVTRDDA